MRALHVPGTADSRSHTEASAGTNAYAVVMYSCNATTGQCALDPRGTQAPGECIATCKCITPNNCGQLNGTAACGRVLTGCNVLQRLL